MKKDKKETKTDSGRFKYFIYYPEEKENNLPLILFLHGMGERGDNLEDIEMYSLPNYMSFLEIPFIVIAPQCHKSNFWNYHLRDVEKVIDLEQKNYNYDMNNIFVLGSSMGAFGAWNYLMERPDLFRGIVSASGGISIPVKKTLETIKDKPILIYHGDNDEVVDVNSSIKAYNMLKEVGSSNVELKIIPGGDHYVCSHAYEDPYVYEWINKNLVSRDSKKKSSSFERDHDDLLAMLNASAIFDESLIKLIADLISIKEAENYVPFMYKKESDIFASEAFTAQNTWIGITKYKNISMYIENRDIEELFKQKYGYNTIKISTTLANNEKEKPYIGLYDIDKDYQGKLFTFEFILNQIGEVGVYYPVGVCKSDFKEFDYVRDYIKYLFDLQVERKGKRLNYEELRFALEDFLNQNKSKTKSKSLN